MLEIIIFICSSVIGAVIIALLIEYFNLHNIVDDMKDTINEHNEQYNDCLDGWEKANELVDKAVSLNDNMIKLNQKLLDELNNLKED